MVGFRGEGVGGGHCGFGEGTLFCFGHLLLAF